MRGKLMFGAASAALIAMAFAAPAAAQDADPAGDAGTEAAVNVGETVSGAIDPAGDADWYRLDVAQGQRYTITLDSAAGEDDASLDTVLALYSDAGEQIAFNDDFGGTLNSRLAYVPDAGGHVFVEARAFSEEATGGYTLRVEAGAVPADDAGNDAATSARVTPGRPINGSIEYEGDTDWYRLNVRTGYTYNITLNGAEGSDDALNDPLLRVVGDDGAELAYNDDYEGLDSALDFIPPRSGPVYVVAGAFSDSYAGAYTLNVTRTRQPADPASADTSTRGRIAPGQTLTSSLDYEGDRDWYRIRLAGGQTYRFSLRGDGDEALGDPFLRLFDRSGEELAMDDDSGGDLNALLEFTAPADGNYFVEARGFSDTASGGYVLSAREGDIPADASTDMTLSADGDYRAGVLSPAGDRDWYRLELGEGQAVRISVSSPDMSLDTMAVLYGPDGLEAARDDDGGAGLNSWLEYQAAASGPHHLEVRGFAEDAQGSYEISVTAGEISDNTDTNEMLGVNDDGRISMIGEPGDSDWFAIELVEGRPYRFTVENYGFAPLADPVLTLYDASGQQVATDDDGGPGLNSYIYYASPTGGPHFVGVASFGEATGGYFLRAADTDVPGHIYTDETLDAVNGDERASRIEMPGDLDYFRVDLETGVRYVIEVNATSPNGLTNPHLILMNEENNEVAADADSGPGRNARLNFTPRETGSFYIQASGAGGTTGAYQVSIVRQ